MAKKRCLSCVGSGKVMGGGMMMQDCEVCDGLGKIFVADDPIDFLNKKNTEAYIESKEKLKQQAPDLKDEYIEKILDEELAKANSNVAPINGKAKKVKRDGEK
jgi:hypothetical protein